MDLFWIKESIINFFQAQSEKVNVMNLNFDNLLYWIGVNPFEPSTSLFILIWIFITFIWILIWIVHIFDNLKNYNTTKTIKKTFLLLLFVLLNIYVLLNIPWLQKYTFIDMSLIYTKSNTVLSDSDVFQNDKTSWTMNETWYKSEVLKPSFSNPFWTDWQDYIYINIYNLFKDEQERLNPKYKSDEEIYKKYIVWINNINGKYRDISINNGYLSNLDLYWIDISNSNLPVTSFSSWFWNFIDNIKDNIKEDDENKKNIINKKYFDLNQPIYYNGEKYFYVSDFQASKFRRDIVLVNEKVEDWNSIKKYIILPYYDLAAILTNWVMQKDIKFFLSNNNKKKVNWNSDIPKDLKLSYKYLYQKVVKEFPTLVKNTSETEDYYTLNNFNPTDNNPFSEINIDRLQYFITYNKAYNNDKYDTNLLLKNSNAELSQIYSNLITLENNYKVFDKLKIKNTPENFKKLSQANKELQDLRDKINLEYKNLWNKNIKWGIIANVSKIYALNLQNMAYSTSNFMLLWDDDKYDKIKKQKGHISLLKQVISDKSSILNQKELDTLNLISSIDKFDKKLTKINIVNKNDIIPYTLYWFIKERKKFEISWDGDALLLNLICEKKEPNDLLSLNTWNYRKEIIDFKSKIWFELNDTIVDCNANNKKWAIINKKLLKDLLYKIITLKNKENMVKEISLIPYLAALRDQNENRFFNPFSTSDNTNNFLDSVINLWKYKLVSPLLYYKLLLSDNVDKIPWFFINLYDMKWIVWTPDNAFNFKLWSSKSWYRDLDVKNWNKYTQTVSVFWIPLLHNIILWILAILNQFLLNWIFILILSTYIILLKKD